MGIGGSYTTLGQKYYLGMHLAICRYPIDKISMIRAGDTTIYDTPITGNGTITIDKPKIWGGSKQGGGIEGDVDIEFGGPAQTENTYLQGVLGTNDIPAFRGIVGAVLNQVYLASLTPSIKPWSFLVQWLASSACGPNSLDMNPAKMLELAITEDWGLQADSSDLETASFTAAYSTLNSEQLGLSYVYNSSTPVLDFIARILQHVMGVLYVDPETGKFNFNLMRSGDSSELILDETNIIEVRQYYRPDLADLPNKVIAHFKDREEFDQIITLHNQPLIEQVGIVNAVDIQYEMCVEKATVQKMAARELRNLSMPLSIAEIVVNRDALSLRVGQKFTFSWDKYGVDSEEMRVTFIDWGSLQNGQIRIEAVQDVYGTDTGLYAIPPASKWVNPYNDPAAADNRVVFEVPYYLLVQRWGESATVWAEIDDDAGWVSTAAERPSGDSTFYELWTKGSAYEEVVSDSPFTPTATLDEALDKEVMTTTTVTEVFDLDLVETGTYCIIAGSTIELAEVTAIDPDTGDITLRRGVMDTVPQEHLINTRAYFAETWTADDPTERYSAEVVYAKILPTTLLGGTLDIASANEDNITLSDRMYRPYPPGNFQLNSEAWPLFITGELLVTWAHRDRLTQTAGYTQQDTGDIGPEAGTTYTVQIYDEDDVLRVNQTGLATTTYTYTLATEISDLGKSRPNEEMRVVVTSVRDGFNNWQSQDYSIPECRGYGMFYGAYYGE